MAYKAKSITSKASSACRMNAALVAGHTTTGTAKKTGMDHFQEGFEKNNNQSSSNSTSDSQAGNAIEPK